MDKTHGLTNGVEQDITGGDGHTKTAALPADLSGNETQVQIAALLADEPVLNETDVVSTLLKYRFREIRGNAASTLGAKASAEEIDDMVQRELTEEIDKLFAIVKRMGVSEEVLSAGLKAFFAQYPEGTDLDKELGASMSGLARFLEEPLVNAVLARLGLGTKFNEAFSNFRAQIDPGELYVNFYNLEAFGCALQVIERHKQALTPDEAIAILEAVIEKVADADEIFSRLGNVFNAAVEAKLELGEGFDLVGFLKKPTSTGEDGRPDIDEEEEDSVGMDNAGGDEGELECRLAGQEEKEEEQWEQEIDRDELADAALREASGNTTFIPVNKDAMPEGFLGRLLEEDE